MFEQVIDEVKQGETLSSSIQRTEIFDSMYLANVLRHLSSVPPESIILPGAPAADDASIWVLDDAATVQRMQELFPPEDISENN